MTKAPRVWHLCLMSVSATAASEDVGTEPPNLSRPDRYRLAAEADVDVRVVDSEWKRWRAGEAAEGPARARIRRVAVAMGLAQGGK